MTFTQMENKVLSFPPLMVVHLIGRISLAARVTLKRCRFKTYQLGTIAKTGNGNFSLTLGTRSVTAKGQSEAHEPRVAKKFNASKSWRMLKRDILGRVDIE